MEKMRKPFKVDRNGTQYFADYRCRRCGGQGGLDEWTYTGWTCYECGGSGKADKPYIWKVYTPEYAKKLEERRAKRAAKRMEERRAKAADLNRVYCERNGYAEDGTTWVYLGNTYDIKDELKSAGATFNGTLGWHSATRIDGYEAMIVTVVFEIDASGVIFAVNHEDTAEAVKEARAEWYAENTQSSNHVGNVGDRIEASVTLLRRVSYDTKFGTMHIFIMKGETGNVFVWKTSAWLEYVVDDEYKTVKEGESCTIKATIKGHGEYNGTLQTELARVKVTRMNGKA